MLSYFFWSFYVKTRGKGDLIFLRAKNYPYLIFPYLSWADIKPYGEVKLRHYEVSKPFRGDFPKDDYDLIKSFIKTSKKYFRWKVFLRTLRERYSFFDVPELYQIGSFILHYAKDLNMEKKAFVGYLLFKSSYELNRRFVPYREIITKIMLEENLEDFAKDKVYFNMFCTKIRRAFSAELFVTFPYRANQVYILREAIPKIYTYVRYLKEYYEIV